MEDREKERERGRECVREKELQLGMAIEMIFLKIIIFCKLILNKAEIIVLGRNGLAYIK